MKTLIVGIGNTILSDDAAGILVARKLYEKVKSKDIDFMESSYAGWRCIDFFYKYDKIVIIDVIYEKNKPVGDCYRVDLPESISLHLQSSHNAGFFESLELARRHGVLSFDKISVYAITAKNIFEFSEEISGDLMQKIPLIVDEIITSEFANNLEAPKYA